MVLVLVFVSVYLLARALTAEDAYEDPTARKNLKSFVAERRKPAENAKDRSSERAEKKAKKLFATLDTKMQRTSISPRLSEWLEQADLKLRVSEFLSICVAVAGAAGLAGFLLRGIEGSVILAGAGTAAPWILLRNRINARRRAFLRVLPDALTLMANSLRSGHSFMQALDMLSREMPAPAGSEFERVVKETRLGVPTEESLTALAKRLNTGDLDLVVTAILIQRQVGGNLAEVLDKINHTIRERIRIAGEVRTLTTQGRLSGWVISMIPIALALFFYVMDPGFMSPLFTSSLGRVLLLCGVIMQLAGMALVRRIVDIQF
ncbi:MAG: type II secretion system F family protein [Bacillota bacterium]